MFSGPQQPKIITQPQTPPGINLEHDSQNLDTGLPSQNQLDDEPETIEAPVIRTTRHSVSSNIPWYKVAASKAIGVIPAAYQYVTESEPKPVGESLKDTARAVVAGIGFVGAISGKGMMKITSLAFSGAGKTFTGIGNIVESGAEGAADLDDRLNKIPSFLIGTTVTGAFFTAIGLLGYRYFHPDLTQLSPLANPPSEVLPSVLPTTPIAPSVSPTKAPTKPKESGDAVRQY
jgi:hypothetical protein